VIPELLSVVAVLAGGCLAARAAGIRGWVLPALGLVAGVSLQLAVGLLQVVTPLPTSPALTLAVTFAAPAAWWALRWRRGDDVRISVPHAAGLLAVLAVVVAVLRAANLAKWHTDSFMYLMAGELIADGRYASDVSTYLLTARTLGVPLLHAPAHLGGDYFLTSIHALLAAATLAIVIWLLRRGLAYAAAPAALTTFAVLGGVLLLTNNRFVFSAFYLNGHLLVALLLLVIAGNGWLLARGVVPADAPPRALIMLQAVAIPALVISRPEAAMLAVLALLPTWLAGQVRARHRMVTVATLGAANTVWQGFVAWIHLARDAPLPLTTIGSLALGVLLLAAIPLLRRPLRVWLLWAAEGGLWLALLGFVAARGPANLLESAGATAVNVLYAGRWGLSVLILILLVLGVLLLSRVPHLTYLRFPVTTFVPLGFLLAYLRDIPYRIGFGDSLSRMFMHVVPLAVLYVIAAMAAAVAARAPAVPQQRVPPAVEGAAEPARTGSAGVPVT
jgi:hypothetical protein